MGLKIRSRCEKDGGLRRYAPLVTKCYPTETLAKLDALKRAWQKANDGSPIAELCWLTLVSILRAASPVGTAQWQYILPRKSKAKSVEPLMAFEERTHVLAADMVTWQEQGRSPAGRVPSRTPGRAKGYPTGGPTDHHLTSLRQQLRLRRRNATK
jgi:hypothetical protein